MELTGNNQIKKDVNLIVSRFWLFGPTTGLVSAVLAAMVFTILDLVRNYGEVFRDSSGTNWLFVYDTAVSWLLPTFLYVTIVASLAHLAVSLLLFIHRKYFSKNSDA